MTERELVAHLLILGGELMSSDDKGSWYSFTNMSDLWCYVVVGSPDTIVGSPHKGTLEFRSRTKAMEYLIESLSV
jgi:hypothetical protein